MIGGMPFLWLRVCDQPGRSSLRGHIEKNAIALLSNFHGEPLDPPSENWLGHHCYQSKMRKSGLWNYKHVDDAYDPAFLDDMERVTEQFIASI